MADRGSWRSHWKPLLALIGWWALLCVFAHHRGVGVFAPFDRTWQLLDPQWLRADPWGSLGRLHAQPPLYNAAVAVILALDVDPQGLIVHAGLDALGAAGGILTWLLALRLGAGPRAAWVAGALLLASPGYWLVAHWLFYDLPVTVLVTALLWTAPAVQQGRTRVWVALVASVVALGWLRSLFHPVWAVGVFAVIAWSDGSVRRRALTIGALTVAVMALPYAKNGLQFGTANASSWAGMSLLRTAHAYSAAQTRRDLAAQGRLSAAGVVGPFRDLDAYDSALATAPCPDPHPTLCAANKPGGGANFNHAAYIGLSRQMVGDAMVIYAAEPSAWVKAQLGSWLAWLRPVGVYPFLRPARQPIDDLHAAWAQIALGEIDGAPVVLAFGVFAALSMLVLRLSRVVRDGRRGPELTLLAVAAWTIAWVALVGNTLEHGENYRFRAYLDPLLLALCASAASALRRQRPGQA